MAKQAFEGSRQSVYLMKPEDVTIIGVDTDDGPEHHLYDERIKWALEENTVLDMMCRGVKVPIEVTKDGDKAIVVDGRRRTMHAREANKRLAAKGAPTLRIRVLPPVSGEARDLLGSMVALNEHREDDSPLNRAKKAKRLLEYGHTETEIAVICKVTPQAVRNWLNLLSLDPSVQKAVERGDLAASAAVELKDLPKAEQKESLEELLLSAPATNSDGKTKRKTARDVKVAGNKRKNGKHKIVAPSRKEVREWVAAATNQEHQFVLGMRFATGLIGKKDLPETVLKFIE